MVQFNFKGKIAIVTGGIKGIGLAVADALVSSGAKVAVTYKEDDEGAGRAEEILKGRSDRDCLVVKSNAADRESTRSLIRSVETRWDTPVSLVVNNAGILSQGDFFDITDNQWETTMRTNLMGPFILCQEIMKKMASGGSIVNISSVGGQIGGDKAPDYAASKAGLISLTRSLARIGSKNGVRVNAVAPGWIETPIFSGDQVEELRVKARECIPLGRTGTPEDVAPAVLFLLSEAASYITGHCLNVNGGLFFG